MISFAELAGSSPSIVHWVVPLQRLKYFATDTVTVRSTSKRHELEALFETPPGHYSASIIPLCSGSAQPNGTHRKRSSPTVGSRSRGVVNQPREGWVVDRVPDREHHEAQVEVAVSYLPPSDRECGHRITLAGSE